MSNKIYEMITNKIVEKLEKGTIPWRKPWINGVAVNWKTKKAYRGINTMLLSGGEYATFKQVKDAGGKVKKGSKSYLVVFWKLSKFKNEDEETGEKEEKTVPLLRYYKVFKIGEQTEGIEPKQKEIEFNHNPITEGEKIIKGYINAPDYTYNSGRAYYKPSVDVVNVPPLKDFVKAEEFYSTSFHEMVHSTGHTDRLNREGVKGLASFGSETYSKEELIAELGASMLCGVAGIDNHTIENSASYIQSWLNALKNDKSLIVSASQKAQKAVDYILNTKFE